MNKVDIKKTVEEAFKACGDMGMSLNAASDRVHRKYVQIVIDELSLAENICADFVAKDSIKKSIEKYRKELV